MRGSVYRTRAGTFGFVHDRPPEPGNPRPQTRKQGFATEDEAQKALTASLYAMDTGTGGNPKKITVSDFLDLWLQEYAEPNLEARTYEGYEQIIRVHLKPYFGAMLLKDVTPLMITRYYRVKRESGRADGKGGLSGKSILHHHRMLHGALEYAVRWKMIQSNPMALVDSPKSERSQVRALSEAEIEKLLRALIGHRTYIPVLLALSSGMRSGELLALRWQDVDLTAGTVLVARAIKESRRRGLLIGPTKTGARHVVALPSSVVQELRLFKALAASQGPDDLIFQAPGGGPLRPTNFGIDMSRQTIRMGIGRYSPKDLRHTHATQLLIAKIHPKIVSERLGHSTTRITLDTYSHVLRGMDSEAAEKFDDLLGRRGGGEESNRN